jgi:D-amino-acid dehydrogenase
MRGDPDVLIIGGGAAGLFCAYHLRRRGRSVVVLERGAVGGAQSCSYGNTGFVGTHGAAPLAEPGMLAAGLRGMLNPASAVAIRPLGNADQLRWLWHFRRACADRSAAARLGVLVDMKRRSLGMLRELSADRGLGAAFTMPGMVLAFRTDQAFERARAGLPAMVDRGVPLRALTLAELRSLEPDADFDIRGALYNEEGAFVRVPRLIVEFARLLVESGVEILSEAEVTGFDSSGGQVDLVRTTHGTFRPGHVVIAAGAWSAQCARKLGVRLTLQPVKGCSITVRAPRNGPRRPVLLAEGRVAITPLGDQLRFAGVMEVSGMNPAVSARRIAAVRRIVRAYLPRMTSTETVETWSGLRPCAPDSLPFLGRAEPYRNLYIAAGHGQMGMGLAPAGGELVAQVIAGEQPDLDLAPFRIDRFGKHAAGSLS